MAALDPNAIVTVQVSTILAPFPSSFQQSGAIVSFGGTNQPTGSQIELTRFSDIIPVLSEPLEIATVAWATGVVTATTTNPLPASLGGVGSIIDAQISGFTPAAYNGPAKCTITGADEFTFPLVADPGAATVVGMIGLAAAVELSAMAATFFRQGTAMTVTVIELGFLTDLADEITRLEDFLTNNPLTFYGYLLPANWGLAANIPDVLTLFQQFEFPEAMTYFWLTIEAAAVGLIPATAKCVVQLIEAPTVKPTREATIPGDYAEFTLAGMFYWAMQYRATAITRVAPMCFKYIYGVTPYPLVNNGPFLVSLKNNFVNYIQTGAEGGINFTNIYQGVTADGFDYFNWWWTIDWVQLQVNIDLSNAIINGSNNPLAPLYYSQNGINFLQTVLVGTMQSGSEYGLVNGLIVATQYDSPSLSQQIQLGTFAGQCDVNAVPFPAYTAQNPDDYGRGEYDGLSALFIPARGFVHILVSVVATDIVTV
jgi:hypothetical protein